MGLPGPWIWGLKEKMGFRARDPPWGPMGLAGLAASTKIRLQLALEMLFRQKIELFKLDFHKGGRKCAVDLR